MYWELQKTRIIIILLFIYSFIAPMYSQENYVNMQNVVRYNENTKLPKAIYNVNSKQYNGTPEEIALQYLIENKTLLGLKDNLDDLKTTEIKESPGGFHVGFVQYYKGIPVMKSETVVSINSQKRITMLINGYKPNISINITPDIGQEQAIHSAKQTISVINSTELFPSRTELIIYPDSLYRFHLAWRIELFPSECNSRLVVISDAHNGVTLEIIKSAGYYTNGTGRVFDPDPGTALNNVSLTDQMDADYLELQAAYDIVTLQDLDDAVGGLYRVRGMYARSLNIQYIQSPYDTVVAVTNPANFTFNRNQNGFEEVNIYYFIDKQRRYIRSLGFSPKWKYLSGSGSDSTLAFDARGSSARNAQYEAGYEYIWFGVPDDNVDAGEDQSVILHEYSHALHDALISGGGIDYAGPNLHGLGEGMADYLSISYRRTTEATPYHPNYRNNWFNPIGEGESILSIVNSNYPANWGPSINSKRNLWASTMMDIEYNDATNPSAGTRLGRDMTTKLILKSLGYTTQYDDEIDNVNAILQADRDIYGGAHLAILASVFNNRGFFYYKQIPEQTLNANTTWTGNNYVTGTVTVKSGVTLSIAPKSFIFFTNGSSLIVNGTLTANGSSAADSRTFNFISPNSTTENGIIFNSGSSGTINYCKIQNAYRGIYENGASVNISYSAISNCTYGIHLYNSSSPTINSCNIHDNTMGIYLVNSSPYLYNNYIRNNTSVGIDCLSSSSPYFGSGSTHGKNDITGNNNGVMCYDNSSPRLGNTSDGGYNNLGDNSASNVYCFSTIGVFAINNYWGTGGYKIYGTGSVAYLPTQPQENVPTPPLSKKGDEYYASLSSGIPLLSDFEKAEQLISEKNLDQAREACLNLIKNYPDYSVSYNALNLLKETYAADDIAGKKNIYKSLFNSKEKKDIYAMAGLILAHIDKENRLKQIDEVINNYAGESVVDLALFDKLVYYNFELNDKENSRAVSKELDKLFPLSIGAIEAHRILGDKEYFNIFPEEKSLKKTSTSTIPTEYSLSDNYPNPFNPTTTINFQIPEDGFVTLKVYDVLGREVALLVNGNKKAGYYSRDFDASRLSSGVYIYKITANNFIQSKKMLMIK